MSGGRAKKVHAVAMPKGTAKDRVKEFKGNAKALFERKPKSPAPDNVGRKVRPAAHGAQQAGVAKRAKRTVKRLSNQVI